MQNVQCIYIPVEMYRMESRKYFLTSDLTSNPYQVNVLLLFHTRLPSDLCDTTLGDEALAECNLP
jgi:hypothetical protein